MDSFLGNLNLIALCIDLILVITIIYNVIVSARLGFFSSFISLVLTVLSYIFVLPLSNVMSQNIYSKYLRGAISGFIEDKFGVYGAKDLEVLKGVLESIVPSENAYFIEESFGKGQIDLIKTVSEMVADKVIYPIVNIFLCIALLYVARTFFSILSKILKHVFKGVSKIPIIGKANIILGGVFGFFRSVIVILFFVLIANTIVSITGVSVQYDEIKSKTYVLNQCDKLLSAGKVSDLLSGIEHKIFNHQNEG